MLKRRLSSLPVGLWWVAGVSLAYLALRAWLFWGAPADNQFGDTLTYWAQYKDGFAHGFWGHARPWGYPFFLWLTGHRLQVVVYAQHALAALAWLALAWSMFAHFRARAARVTALAGTLLVSLTLNVIQWDGMVLTESLSNTLFAAAAAGWLWLARRERWPAAALGGWVVAAILFAAIRDSNNMLLPAWGVLLLAGLARRAWLARPAEPRRRWWTGLAVRLALIGVLVLGFVVHQRDVNRTQRYWSNIANVMQMRAFVRVESNRYVADTENIDWFLQRQQMPREALDHIGRHFSARPPGPVYAAWLKQRGNTAWMRFLLTHPGWAAHTFFGGPSVFGYRETIYMTNANWPRIQGGLPAHLHNLIYDVFGGLLGAGVFYECVTLALIAFVLAWLVILLRRPAWAHAAAVCEGAIWLLVTALATLGLALFGDAIENWRHALLALVALYVFGVYLVAMMIDAVAARRRRSVPVPAAVPEITRPRHRKRHAQR